MANQLMNLALQSGYAADGVSTVKGLKRIPFLDVDSSWVDQNVNGRKRTYDGYEFETDWNGSTNYMRVRSKDIFNTYEAQGLHLDTTATVGKDRRLIIQYLDTDTGLFPANTIGYTGLWRTKTYEGFHPRLDMVVFHYMSVNGGLTFDYKVDRPLYDHNSTSHTWRYGATGNHAYGVDWRIGYTIDPSRYANVYSENMYLAGMTMDIKFRTGPGSHTIDGTFYHFKPIIANSASTQIPILSTNSSTLTSGKRLVIPADGNTWPVSGDMKLT